MLCLGIIWNSVQQFKDSIIEDIEKQGKVLGVYSLQLGDIYDDFVRDIYSKEVIDDWKIEKKISTMHKSSESRDVTLVFLEMDITKQYYHEGKKKMVFASLDRLKQSIRRKYSKLVKEYFFDNVFHLTDDEKEFRASLIILNDYIYVEELEENFDNGKPKIKILKAKEHK